ncbi:uncharacterized protein LOC124393112 [Silurus meridionalis]|uniref:uncharacterized protein LOC124393112 n=1 Tax=Silurus meridionalis TaxID=175797 RepID=UPI001EE9B3FC|nr:uncharacterized protein LOC124393112 [Silurus meridionalis]
MILLKYLILVRFLWTLLSLISVVKAWDCSKYNSTQIVHQGLSTTINCSQKQDSCLKNRNGAFTVVLRRNNLLCTYFYLNLSWTKQLCKDNIRLVWIPETAQISFDLLNIQINQSGVYTCTIDEHIPPPTHCLFIQRTFIHVIASPSVSLVCVKGPNGAPTMLCASESFYPADLQQAWLKDGEYISYLNTSFTPTYKANLNTPQIIWNYRNNTNGSYNLTSYLHLPSNTAEQVMYHCWVNHSALSKPITVSISTTECTQQEVKFTGFVVRFIVVGTFFGLLIAISIFMEVYYQHFRSNLVYQQHELKQMHLLQERAL